MQNGSASWAEMSHLERGEIVRGARVGLPLHMRSSQILQDKKSAIKS